VPQHHLTAQVWPRWRLAPLDGATWGLVDHRQAAPLPRSRALATAATVADVGFAVAARAALPAATTAAAAAIEAPTALATGTAPTALRATLHATAVAAPPAAAAAALAAAATPAPLAAVPLQAALLFLFFFFSLMPFIIHFPPLFDKVQPDGPWRLFPNKRGLDLFVRSTSVCRVRIATRPLADGDGVTHSPRLGWLGSSLLAMGTRRLDPPR
jgi:hypothetical protein